MAMTVTIRNAYTGNVEDERHVRARSAAVTAEGHLHLFRETDTELIEAVTALGADEGARAAITVRALAIYPAGEWAKAVRR